MACYADKLGVKIVLKRTVNRTSGRKRNLQRKIGSNWDWKPRPQQTLERLPPSKRHWWCEVWSPGYDAKLPVYTKVNGQFHREAIGWWGRYEKYGTRETRQLHVFTENLKKTTISEKKQKKPKKRRNFMFFSVFFAFFCNLNLTKYVKRNLRETRPCGTWVLATFT